MYEQVGYSNWDYMGRNYGAVWETKKPLPKGPLQLRFVVTSGYDGKWIWAKYVLPADWRPGLIYDTGVQISDIAKEGCPTEQCGDGQWKRQIYLTGLHQIDVIYKVIISYSVRKWKIK